MAISKSSQVFLLLSACCIAVMFSTSFSSSSATGPSYLVLHHSELNVELDSEYQGAGYQVPENRLRGALDNMQQPGMQVQGATARLALPPLEAGLSNMPQLSPASAIAKNAAAYLPLPVFEDLPRAVAPAAGPSIVPPPPPPPAPAPTPAPPLILQSPPPPATTNQVEMWQSSAKTSSQKTLGVVVELDRVALINGNVYVYDLDEQGKSVSKVAKGAKLKPYKGFDGSQFMNPAPQVKHMSEKLDISTCKTIWRGVSLFHSPWVMPNLFHLHNDNMLPILDNLLDTEGGLTNERHLFLYRDYKTPQKYVSWAKVLWKLFDDDIHKAQEVIEGGPHCFETIRWGRGDTAFYDIKDKGRRRHVVAELNKWALQAYSVNLVARERPQVPRVLYFKRSWKKKSDDRFMGNLDAVRDIFASKGLEFDTCCDFENMSEGDLLKVFKEHDVFMGVHGAGLTNALYAPPGGIMVEWHHEYKFQEVLFREISHAAAITHINVDCRKTAKPDKGFFIPTDLAHAVATTVLDIWQGRQPQSHQKITVTKP